MNLTKKNLSPITAAFAVLALTTSVQADQVILDDLIVDGSICAGMDCVNGESFGFDTIRLKENNLRIRAVDTSSTASFPSRDWQLTFNDSANGGLNKFSIDDIDGGRTPFTIEGNAPSNSLYVDDGGRLGLGTSTPVVDVHVKSGNTPTMRLEQDGSSGFQAQTWDVAGNEAGFFVRDATNGSTLPFRIRPGAPSSAIDVAPNGNVGIGTGSPGANIHVVNGGSAITGSGSTSAIFQNNSSTTDVTRVTLMSGDTGNSQIGFGDSSSEIRGRIRYDQTDETMDIFANELLVLELDPIGTDLISNAINTAVLTTAGVWQDASSRELKKNIKLLSLVDALSTLENLNPVTFIYKADPSADMNVGFIAEDVPELVATSSRKTLASLDIIAVLTKVAQGQKEIITNLEERIKKMEIYAQNNSK